MQLDIFSSIYTKFRFTKPIRLVELFAGYGSQALALKYLGIEFEHYKVIEFDKYAIGTYNELHNTNFETRDILKVQDLEIVETNKYDYLMTYSFPCTDLSLAGKGGGMRRESNTRSGLLWEVERLLKTSKELPRVLMMENVPQIHSNKHLPDFIEWMSFLESLGYKNYWQDLNAKNYGIPQTRNRTFMISVLGDYSYTFPTRKKLELKLKDMLEEDVSEKYYLSEKMIKCLTDTANRNGFIRAKRFRPHNPNESTIAFTITTRAGGRPCDNFIYAVAHIGDGVYTNRTHSKRGVVQRNAIPTLKTSPHDIGVVVNDPNEMISIRRLTPRECFRLMGVKDADIDKITCSDNQKYKQAGNSIVVNVLMAIFKEMVQQPSIQKNKMGGD